MVELKPSLCRQRSCWNSCGLKYCATWLVWEYQIKCQPCAGSSDDLNPLKHILAHWLTHSQSGKPDLTIFVTMRCHPRCVHALDSRSSCNKYYSAILDSENLASRCENPLRCVRVVLIRLINWPEIWRWENTDVTENKWIRRSTQHTRKRTLINHCVKAECLLKSKKCEQKWERTRRERRT